VRNLEQGCARLHARCNLGPFVGGSEFVLQQHCYRGRAVDPIRLRGVFVQSGDMNIELVQILSAAPSAFHDMYPAGTEGFHHVAMFCDDYERERDGWVQAGYPVASEFTVPWGAKICYIDARSHFGHMIELYPEDEIIRGMYRQARVAADGWDGARLIVPWS
jgi:hypothetical protein